MIKPSTAIRKLAGQMLAAEASRRTDADVHEAVLVCEKLRVSLTRLAGAEGFTALMRRSLALAQADAPALKDAKLGDNGCIDVLELNGDAVEAGTALTAHFLWLLVTFVGEPIALRLVREAWPDMLMDD